MVETNTHKTTNMYPQLHNAFQFMVDKINVTPEIRERGKMNKTLRKYIAAFKCVDKTVLVLSATSGGVSIASFTIVIATPVEITTTSLGFIFSFSNGISKIISKTKEKQTQQNCFISKKQTK